MSKKLRVLIVEDSEDDAELLLSALRSGGYEPLSERVVTHKAMADALKKKTWDVITCDYSMPHFNGLQALKLLRSSALDIPCIIVSGKIGEDTAVQLMKAGANDYVMKGNIKRLAPAIEREMGDTEARYARKLAEETLIESEEKYHTLFKTSFEGILISIQLLKFNKS
jgi:sigma-B regulation protein RsbU (phosphoserine phosphatase)